MKKVFIRFGDIPQNGKSKIYCGEVFEGYEVGVSVYEAIKDGDNIQVLMPSLTYSACVSLSGCLERPMLEVTGEVIGKGSDGEPLLKNCKRV